MKTLIAIPCMDSIPYRFAEMLLDLHKPEGTSVCFKPNSLIYDSRNLLSLMAIENNFDYVLWIDSDTLLPNDTIARLLKVIETTPGCDMATGIYFKREAPFTPVIFDRLSQPDCDASGKLQSNVHTYTDYPRNAVFRVHGCGFGCVLMRTSLLRRVWQKFGPAFSPYVWASEDISFCHRVNLLGSQILCDSSVSCGHVGQYIYTEDDQKRGEQH